MDDITQHSNKRLSTILRNPSHPMHSAAKAERDRRMAKREDNDLDEINLKDLSKKIAQSSGNKNLHKALKKSKDQTVSDLAAMRKRLDALKAGYAAESVELDEISNKTLTRYAMSADNDVQKRRSNRPAGKGDESDPKIGKRLDKINLAHKKGAFKEEVELDEAVNVKGIQKAVDDGKSMDVIMTMFANKRTTNTDQIRKVVKDYMWKKRMKKEEVELGEAKQVLAHGGKGQYKIVSDGGAISVMFKGKVVGKGDFDRGANSFFVSMKGQKGQKSFDDAQDIADYFAKMKIKEEVELDEGKGMNMNLKLINKIKKSGVVKTGSMSKDGAKKEETNEVLDTPKAMQSYRDKAKYSADRAASSAAAKILRGKDKDGNRADHSPEVKTRDKRAKGLKMVDRNATRKVFKALRKEATQIDEASKEGTIRIIDLGRMGKGKGFQVQRMTKGKFVDQGKPYKSQKDAEKVRKDGQHSMQFEAAPKIKGDWLKKERERNREHDAAMGRTATGRKKPTRTMTSTQKSLASFREQMAEGGKKKSETVNEKYKIIHKTMSAALQHAYDEAEKKGFEVDKDDIDNKVAMGPRKPSSGKTNSYNLGLSKNGKPVKQKLHIQVYNMDNKGYELNMYVS